MGRLDLEVEGMSEVLQAMDRLHASQERQAAAVGDTNQAYQQLDRVARGIIRRNETAVQSMERLQREAKEAFDAGRISADQYQRELRQIENEMDRNTGRFRRFNQQQEQTFGGISQKRIAAFVTGLGLVAAAERAITEELQAQKELRDSAAETRLDLGQARSQIIRNLVGSSPEQITSVLARSSDLAADLTISETFIAPAIAQGLSASGGDIEATFRAVRRAGQFLGDDPSQIPQFAGSLLDLAGVTGTTDANVNLGLLTGVGGFSRVVAPQQQAQNIPRALIGARAFGASTRGAAAIFATLTGASADFTGATGATGTIALARQLQQFALDEDPTVRELERLQNQLETQQGRRKPDRKKISEIEAEIRDTRGALSQIRRVNDEIAQFTTAEGRALFLQSRPELAAQFLGDASFEQGIQGPITQLLLDPSSAAAQLFAQNLARFPDVSGLGAQGAQSIQNLGLDPLATQGRVGRVLGTFTEGQRARAGLTLGRRGIEDLTEILARTGEFAADDAFRAFVAESQGGITIPETIEFLQEQQRGLRRTPFFARFLGSRGAHFAPDAQDLRNADSLQPLIERLIQINEDMLAGQREQRGRGLTVRLEGTPE